MPSEIFARDDERIMRLLQEWPDLLDIMGVTRAKPDRSNPADGVERAVPALSWVPDRSRKG